MSVLFPPAGLILLWARSGTRIGKKLLGSLGIAVLSVAYLHLFFGIRVEVDGSGTFPIVSLYKAESHFEELEQSRAEQRGERIESPLPPANLEQEVETRQELAEVRTEAATESLPAAESAAVPLPFWTDFRGPRRDGRYDEMEILTDWPSDGLPLLWRQSIGGGYASFVVADGRAYTIEQRRHTETVAAYDVQSGHELWRDSWPAEFHERMGGDGPRATPTWDGGRLYALGATGELRCLRADSGKLLWSGNILSDNQASNLMWGMAASPLIVEDKVIVLPGGPSGKSVVAYDKLTGKAVWKALDDKQAYTSPMLVTLAGRRQLLVVSAERAMGLTVEDGSLLWDYPWVTDHGINVAQPIIIGGNRFLLSAGYGHGAALVEVNGFGRTTSSRTSSPAQSSTKATSMAWTRGFWRASMSRLGSASGKAAGMVTDNCCWPAATWSY
jgi:outer membrane protein assembly factor BamB